LRWYWLKLGFCHRFDWSEADMNRLMESSVGTVSPALSSLSKPHEPPELVWSPPPEWLVSYQ